MNTRFFFAIITLALVAYTNTDAFKSSIISENTMELKSPNGKNTITFMLDTGKPMYNVSRSGQVIIEPSEMGFIFKNGAPSLGNLELVTADSSSRDETWRQVWGEKLVKVIAYFLFLPPNLPPGFIPAGAVGGNPFEVS